MPWNDETAFIAQAFELAQYRSFFVYGLNSEWIVMWMPPGYMLLLAGVYKVLGYSFAFVFSVWLMLLSLLLDLQALSGCAALHLGVAGVWVLLLYPFATYSWAKTEQMGPLWPRAELLRKSFLAPSEIAKVRDFIAHLPAGQKVSFGYTGIEPFFLADTDKAQVLWSVPMHSVVQPFPSCENDFRVFCDSSLYPKYVFVFDREIKARVGADSGCEIIKMSSVVRHTN